MNLPNQITLSRLVVALAFFLLLAAYDVERPRPWLLYAGLVLLMVAALTDWLDGYVARKRNQVTPLGRILDPFVDKVLVCGAYVFFAGEGFVTPQGTATFVAPWMAVVITARELLVTGLRGVAEASGRAFGADAYGKAKTIIQIITACVVMLSVSLGSPQQPAGPLQGLTWACVWITVAITAFSGVHYRYKARDLLVEG
jgi:CDP-diacylglycerol--glycerol-3-phosphate 3-phosphatidyltransferase